MGRTCTCWSMMAAMLALLVGCPYPPKPDPPANDDDVADDDDSPSDDDDSPSDDDDSPSDDDDDSGTDDDDSPSDDDDDSADDDCTSLADGLPDASMPYYLANATVWTGSTTPLDDHYVVIADGRVVAVRAAPPKTGACFDAAGAAVLPGLIDANVMITTPPVEADVGDFTAEAVGSTLAAGITAVVDTGSPDWIEALSERIDAGDIAGPKLLIGGRIRQSDGQWPCAPLWRNDRCLSHEVSDGSVPTLDSQVYRALVIDVARADGPAFDVVPPASPPILAWLEHADDWSEAIQPTSPADPVTHFASIPYSDSLPTPITATVDWAATALSPHQAWRDLADVGLGPRRLLGQAVLPERVDAAWTVGLSGAAPYDDLVSIGAVEAGVRFDTLSANLALLHAAPSATILPGSASGSAWVPHGPGFHQELRLLAGQSIWASDNDLLVAATVGSASALGLDGLHHLELGQHDDQGRFADLVIVEAGCEPWLDLTCLEDGIVGVIRRGEYLDEARRAELRAGGSWRRRPRPAPASPTPTAPRPRSATW